MEMKDLFEALLHAHYNITASILIFSFPFLVFLLYSWIRPWFSIRVQCWFCNKVTYVPYGNKNCWDCVGCDQYNGFKEDGDYNKPIPAQYDENLNFPVCGGPPRDFKSRPLFGTSNGLCSQCNANQAVKVKLLASFVPVQPNTEDEELKAYTAHLDKIYSLCWNCDVFVLKNLSRQDSLLRHSLPPSTSKHNFSIAQAPNSLSKPSPRITILLHFVSLLTLVPLLMKLVHQVSILMSWNEFSQTTSQFYDHLPPNQHSLLSGFLVGILSIFLTKRERWHLTDAFYIFSWVALQLAYSNQNLEENMTPETTLALKSGLLLVAILVGLARFKSFRKTSEPPRTRITTYKLNSSFDSNSSIKSDYQTVMNASVISDYQTATNASVMSDYQSVEDQGLPLDVKFDKVHITPPSLKKYQLCEEDLLSEFEINPFMRRHPIVRPARFNPLTHSSWVAGGFWANQDLKPNTLNCKDGTAIQYAMAGFQSSGFCTPPPSLNGSQQSPSTAGSQYPPQSYSAASTVRSWPPSLHSRAPLRFSPHSLSLSQSTASSNDTCILPAAARTRSWPRVVLFCLLGCSLIANIVLLRHPVIGFHR